MTIATFNIVLVVGTGSWIADHVPFAQRSRVVGLNETSWALGTAGRRQRHGPRHGGDVVALGVRRRRRWRPAIVLVVVLIRLDGHRRVRCGRTPEPPTDGQARVGVVAGAVDGVARRRRRGRR